MSQLRRYVPGIVKIGSSVLNAGISVIKFGSVVYCVNKIVGDITIVSILHMLLTNQFIHLKNQ